MSKKNFFYYCLARAVMADKKYAVNCTQIAVTVQVSTSGQAHTSVPVTQWHVCQKCRTSYSELFFLSMTHTLAKILAT